MNYSSVRSRNIDGVGYDFETSTLGIRFLNGSEYHYLDVPDDIYNGLLQAESPGKFLNKYVIKAGYSYRRII